MTISTHVLDTSIGRPAAGIEIRLSALDAGGSWGERDRARTDDNGRVANLGAGESSGRAYCLSFDVGTYFRERGVDSFYSLINVEFVITDPDAHYHVPLLVSPYGYSTYRGS